MTPVMDSYKIKTIAARLIIFIRKVQSEMSDTLLLISHTSMKHDHHCFN